MLKTRNRFHLHVRQPMSMCLPDVERARQELSRLVGLPYSGV
jgi:hypothetical protein